MQKESQQQSQFVKAQGMDIKSSISFLIHSARQDAKRRWCSYCLSFMSVMIVVASSALSQTIIDRAPIIFLKSAEGPASETDIILTPIININEEQSPIEFNNYSSFAMLNLTKINQIIGQGRDYQTTPRNSQPISLSTCAALNLEDFPIGSIEHLNQQQFIQQIGNNSKSHQATLAVIDTAREQSIYLGREYPFPPLAQHECIVSERISSGLGLKVGDYILISEQFNNFHTLYLEHWLQLHNEIDHTQIKNKIYMPFQIKYLIDQAYGKFSDGSTDSLVILEYGHFFQNLAYWGDYLQYSKDMFDANPQEFSPEVRINIPNRLDIYLKSNYEDIQFEVTRYASQIRRSLGVYPFDMSLPVLENLFSLRFGQMFLGIILNMIIVILFLLSLVLLYNLLLISVETKTYEMGVLRVLGFNKLGVVFLILVQAMSYVIPAIVCGLILSIPFLAITSNLLKSAIGVEFAIYPTGNAVALALCLGLLIPLVSAISPIQEALKQQLSFALDLNRSKSSAVKVEVDMEGNAIPWGRITFALVASVFGVSIYFLLPLALLSFNISLLLSIFFLLLCSMLLGFVLLAFNFQYLMERFIVWVFFIWASKATGTLILKNLAAHRIKNRRTALMYSLSIAFVIFISTGMSVQIMNQMYSTLQYHGTYMEVYVAKNSGSTIQVYDMEMLMYQMKDHVADYTWITKPLDSYMQTQGYKTVYITHIGRIYQLTPIVVGVSPSLFKLGFNDFLNVGSRGPLKGLDPVEELYTPRGSQSCIIGKSYADYLNLDTNFNSTMLLVVFNNSFSKMHEMRVSSVLNTAPALKFSIIPSVTVQSVVVSLPTYMRLSSGAITDIHSIPMGRLLLKFTPNAKIDLVYRTIKALITYNGDEDIKIWDYRDYQKSLEQSQSLITIIFTALTIIVMVLCFFSLSTAMSANLMEQVKEISVLRAIGNSRTALTLLYIYESFVLVLSSSLIGLFVGYCIGFTMALQQTLITQLPLFFVFPWQLLIAIILISVVCAILSTYLPAQRILRQEISQIMRMN